MKSLDQIDDTTVRNALDGNMSSFEMVFKAWYPVMCNFAHSLTSNREDAEEIVQSVFVNLWEKRTEVTIDQSAKAYLFRSVRNACLNKWKHDKVRKDFAKDQTEVATGISFDSPSNQLDGMELEQRIAKALEKIPTQCREVFTLSRFGELKYSEIAEKLGISVKTVENQMGKALRIMREELSDYLIWIVVVGGQMWIEFIDKTILYN
ncbi:MAG: RNA polymerase sigma-70 factor [Flavobacteriales bacterium]|nr:RNA polymerase sigma-70 factor [Flavobacteriales bacterium]